MSGYAQALGLLEKASNAIPFEILRRDVEAIAHKLRHPMADILEKIPGATLTERAKAIGVSRQTMYVWMDEQFRPNADQAALISKLTGEPAANIRADGFKEGNGDIGRTTAAKVEKLASGGKAASGSDGRAGRGSGRRRVDAPQKRSRSVRARHKRSDG